MADDLVKRLRDIQGQAGLFASAAADRIEQLEREAILDAKLLADTRALLDTALEAVIDAKLVAEAKVQALEAERDAALAALEDSGRKRGETLALRDKAADALKTIAHLADGERVGGIARAVLTELPEVRALIRQAVDKAVRIVMDEVGYEEEDLCKSCRDSLAAIREGRNER